ncbi:DNA fragmentation factor subunit alpha [Carcharodon carcharias]|uniref:DNA fragmentation factor subunit alpha n=1 Tax=Carcharodon carcharias TaxID=13397 RepID=UPI001B7F1548|nr:DNA fragmentation factor subunit alpha [Carcharodon carcharias]
MDPQSRKFPCKICGSSRLRTFGVVATSLEDLIAKGKEKLGLDKFDAQQAYTIVLEDDGTIVEDEDYFMCLPANTTFMILNASQKWTPVDEEISISSDTKMDDDVGGVGSVDCVDYPESSNNWKVLAKQLRKNLAHIITMSESDLQTLIDVPSTELAKELEESLIRTEAIQDSLQRALDSREEHREAKELLKLYQNAFQNDDSKPAKETDQVDGSDPLTMETSRLNKRIVGVLRQKPSPELSLSNVELQEVLKESEKELQSALNCSIEKVKDLQEDCRKELKKRLSKMESLEQLRKHSTKRRKL